VKDPGSGGGTNGCLKRKVFKKNQKHQPNIVKITHLRIMHEKGIYTPGSKSLRANCMG
jgi:hypothetical protein